MLFGLISVVVVIGLGSALFASRHLPRRWERKPCKSLAATKYPYQARQRLLTQSEHNFYGVLKNCLSAEHILFCQVRLADFVQVAQGTRHWQRCFNQIQSKSVDFLVCDAETLSPLLVIELDEASHQQAARRRHNTFVEHLLTAADLPLLRIRVQYAYTASELKLAIREKLKRSDSEYGLIPPQSRQSYAANGEQPVAMP
jgi:hypothetical protein